VKLRHRELQDALRNQTRCGIALRLNSVLKRTLVVSTANVSVHGRSWLALGDYGRRPRQKKPRGGVAARPKWVARSEAMHRSTPS
jgi:hypothetical protein